MCDVLLSILAALPLAQVLLGRLVLRERLVGRACGSPLPVAEVGSEVLLAMAARAEHRAALLRRSRRDNH